MDGEVLAAGGGFQVPAVALQALDEADAQTAGQIGILAVGFMAAAPAGIAENVDIRAPDGQSLIDIPVLMGALAVVLGPGLVGDDGGDFLLHVLVKHGGQADGLGEDGRRAGAGYAVKHLVPPVVGGHAEPRNGRRIIFQLGGFFLQGHAGYQIFCPAGRFASVSHGGLLNFGFKIPSIMLHPAGLRNAFFKNIRKSAKNGYLLYNAVR